MANERFGLWGFGDNYKNLYPYELINEWNNRHINIYRAFGSNSIKNDLIIMYHIYLNEMAKSKIE
jgi:hypothetical protein